MDVRRPAAVGLLAALMVAPTPVLGAGPQAPDARALAAAVEQHAASQDADRSAIRSALERTEVREVAERLGVDLSRISATIDTMAPSDLTRAAQAARQVNQQLERQIVGGDLITISTTTLIIVLLLVLLLVVALK